MPHDYGSSLRDRLIRYRGVSDPAADERGELKPGERRDIAVLFLDLEGFTSLSEKLDHEAVHDIASGIMDALVDVSQRFGGYVDKIEGDRIMVLFGARQAGENDSTRAVSSGFMMLDTIMAANDILSGTGIPITARIGINSGPVTVAPDAIGHLTAMGRTVNLASRMEEAAQANTILVPDTFQKKCSDQFTWEDIGIIKLKGISDPVRAWRPTGSISASRPRWERISTVCRSGFVGRAAELIRLRKKLLDQKSGTTGKTRLGGVKHIVLGIKGEAGIGKSRLVHEFIQQHCGNDENITVLKGQSLSFAQPAYSLWSGLLRNLLDIEQDCRLDYNEFRKKILTLSDERELSDSVPFLAELLSIRSGDRRLAELDSKAIALETRIAFRNLLKAMAGKEHLIVVLDDLHWINPTCRNVLEFIIGNCVTERPIVFILIYRPERDDGKAVDFDIMLTYAALEEVALSSIDEQASRDIIMRMLSCISTEGTGKTSPKVEEFFMKHSRGNPFFLEELILDLSESELLKEDKGQWVFSSPVSEIYIPSSLTGLLQSRVDRLSGELKGVLQKSSVLGVEFQLKLYNRLATELSLDENSRSVFNNLERRQFLIGGGTAFEQKYAFRHILIRDTAYNSILQSNKKLLHRITASLIEEMYPDDEQEVADILAHHWERADKRDKAIQWGIISLNYAKETYQHEKVLESSQKLESWILEQPQNVENTEKLLDVMMCRNETLNLLGRSSEQKQLLLRMKGIADTCETSVWQGKIQFALGIVFRITGRMSEAEECYRTALEIHRRCQDRKQESMVLCNLGILSRIQGRTDEAQEYFKVALEMNLEEGDRKLEGTLLGNFGNFYFDQGRMDKAIEYYEKALEINRETGDRRNEGIALGNLGNPYLSMNEIEQALNYYQQALELHREIGNRKSEGVTLGNLGTLYYDHDRFEESLECYQMALEIHLEVGNLRLEAITLAALALLRMKQDDYKGALEYYQDTLLIIEELQIPNRGFDRFTELRGSLLSCGFAVAEVTWPRHWDRPQTE
ncbi:MAG: tetratricopeptide repeat protein [Candidatus Aegiribacteria sp.]|nr:tetratricopeptide repeat protein [Candidatus Aegiribacteria sp.]